LAILTHDELSVKYVCAHHFSECDIRQAGNRVILKKTAIPLNYNTDISSYNEPPFVEPLLMSPKTPTVENSDIMNFDEDDELHVLKPTFTYSRKSPKTPIQFFSRKHATTSSATFEQDELNILTPINAHRKTTKTTPNLTSSSRLNIQELINMPTPKEYQSNKINNDDTIFETPKKKK
jgi:hypothetical protein